MKNKFIFIIIALILVIAIAGCTAENNTPAATVEEPVQAAVETATEAPAAEEPATVKVETDFPLLPDAENIMDMDGTILYQSPTSLADAFTFYKNEFTAQGLVQNEILTVQDDTMFQLVFTGSENGKSLVVQTLKLSDTSINVTLRYE